MKFVSLLFLLVFSVAVRSQPPADNVDDTQMVSTLTAEQTQQAVQRMAQHIEANYLYPEKAKAAAAMLRGKLAMGDFNRQYDVGLLNLQISTLLAKATDDTGFELVPYAANTRLDGTKPSISISSASQHQLDRFETGMLNQRIGYVRITGNFDYPDRNLMIAEQFQPLASADALIIDLRQADHASLTVALQLMSYFVPPDTAIAHLQMQQHTNAIHTVQLTEKTPFKAAMPVYIVTSAFVAGSWEFFSYTLQQHDKAVIVGEQTMGVGYLSQPYPVSDQLAIRLNHALITQAPSGSHWDEKGVEPDYAFSSNDAFDKAYQLALARLAAD